MGNQPLGLHQTQLQIQLPIQHPNQPLALHQTQLPIQLPIQHPNQPLALHQTQLQGQPLILLLNQLILQQPNLLNFQQRPENWSLLVLKVIRTSGPGEMNTLNTMGSATCFLQRMMTLQMVLAWMCRFEPSLFDSGVISNKQPFESEMTFSKFRDLVIQQITVSTIGSTLNTKES